MGQGEPGGDGVVVDEQAFSERAQRGHPGVVADEGDPGVRRGGVFGQVTIVVGGEQRGEGADVVGGCL